MEARDLGVARDKQQKYSALVGRKIVRRFGTEGQELTEICPIIAVDDSFVYYQTARGFIVGCRTAVVEFAPI